MSKLTRRQLVGGAAALAAAPLAAPAVHAQGASGSLTLMAYAGIFQDLYTKAVVEPFMKAHPNVKVQYFPGGTSAAMLGQLRAQKADPQIDAVIMDAGLAHIANQEGVLTPIAKGDFPVLGELFPQADVNPGFGPAVTFDNLVLCYDSTKVAGKPTSLAELWKPEYKGKIGIGAVPNIQGIALTIMVARMLGEDHNRSIDKAIAKIAELAPGVQTFDPQPDGYTMLLNGSLVWCTGWHARSQYFNQDSKGRLAVMVPAEGSVLQFNTINIVKGAKNTAAARAFFDYALSQVAQKTFTELMYYTPVNAKAQIEPAALARTSLSQLDRMIKVDWVEIAKARDMWTNRWKREIIAKSR